MDFSVLYFLNKLASSGGIVGTLITMFSENPLLRGGPIFFCICYLWFSTNNINVRVRIIMGCLACILGVLISVFCQSHVPIHVRPVYDNRLGLVNILKCNLVLCPGNYCVFAEQENGVAVTFVGCAHCWCVQGSRWRTLPERYFSGDDTWNNFSSDTVKYPGVKQMVVEKYFEI
jgi:hypothetical protein